MSDNSQIESSSSADAGETTNATGISGGVSIDADNVNAAGDIVGRDKITVINPPPTSRDEILDGVKEFAVKHHYFGRDPTRTIRIGIPPFTEIEISGVEELKWLLRVLVWAVYLYSIVWATFSIAFSGPLDHVLLLCLYIPISIGLLSITQVRINCLTLLRRKGLKTGHFLALVVNQIGLT